MLPVFLTLILTGAGAFAQTLHPCADLVTPSPIARIVQPVYTIEVSGAVGRVYRPGEVVPPLASGAYLWLVNGRRELLLAPKYDVLRFMLDGSGLATHKGLLLAYAAQMGFGTEDEIVAAGQLRVAYGIVPYVSNRSGNFPAGMDNLDFGYAVLDHYGLPLVEGVTKKLEFAKDSGHTPPDRTLEEGQLMFLAAVDRKHEARTWRELFDRMGRVLLTSAGTPVAVTTKLMEISARRNYLALGEILMTFGKGLEPDGLTYAIYQGCFGENALKIRLAWNQVPWYLERWIETHPDLNPTALLEMRKLIEDFRAHIQKTKQ